MTVRGRLAPSPTGYLHLGNAWAFLLAWLACRSARGSLVLRMEDLDPERSRPVFADAVIDDLRWLGLDWDEGPDKGGAFGPYSQGERASFYESALCALQKKDCVYPCYCTRKELRELAGAPHPSASTEESPFGDLGAPYPGSCRNLSDVERLEREKAGRRACLRLFCPDRTIRFTDDVYGPHEAGPADFGGDFALQRSDGVVSYQLAVTVDDGLMGISQVVRGADLLSSTPRQLLLFELLDFPPPRYCHIPLLCDAEGFRLAKRHGSLTLRSIREAGVEAQAVTGYLGWKAGLLPRPERMGARELVGRFGQRGVEGLRIPRIPGGRILLEQEPLSVMSGMRAG